MALKNAFADLATLQVIKDIQQALVVIASKMGQNDGTGRMLVTAAVTSMPTTAVTLTATSANQGTAAAQNAPWNIQHVGLDQSYQSMSAYAEGVRSKVTVS